MGIVKLQNIPEGAGEMDAIKAWEMMQENMPELSIQERLQAAKSIEEIGEVMQQASLEARNEAKDLIISKVAKSAVEKIQGTLNWEIESDGKTIQIDQDWTFLDQDLVSPEEVAILERYGISQESLAQEIDTARKEMIAGSNTTIADIEMKSDKEYETVKNEVRQKQAEIAQNQKMEKAWEEGMTTLDEIAAVSSTQRQEAMETAWEEDMNALDKIATTSDIQEQEAAERAKDAALKETLTAGLEAQANLIKMTDRFVNEGITDANAAEMQELANTLPDDVKTAILERVGWGSDFKVDGKIGRQTRALNQYMLNNTIPEAQMTAVIGKPKLTVDGIAWSNTLAMTKHLEWVDNDTKVQYAQNFHQLRA